MDIPFCLFVVSLTNCFTLSNSSFSFTDEYQTHTSFSFPPPSQTVLLNSLLLLSLLPPSDRKYNYLSLSSQIQSEHIMYSVSL